ncbi:hypothetical protein ACFQ7F_08225 [Streptomyces sp. NPDC056486]|uniref:hypothetical protein n=1 Tax=Streptomyces sp. NPDC056486 TaxID=3345835 RepID=UPI0036A68B06
MSFPEGWEDYLVWHPMVSPGAFLSLRAFVYRLEECEGGPRPEYLASVAPDVVAAGTLRERSQLATKVHLESPELYGEFDRKEAEADFRLNMGIALSFLCVTIAIESEPWAAFGIILGAVLTWRSFGLLRASNDVLAEAVIAEKITSYQLSSYANVVQELHSLYRPDGQGDTPASNGTISGPPSDADSRDS